MAENQTRAKRAASVVGSVASMDSKAKARSYPLWPEFNEVDINSEKWDGSLKPKDKGKSPSLQFFDDPEGKIEMPSALKVCNWKRPQDFLEDVMPSVMENEQFDLISCNEHLLHCSITRNIISQLIMAQNFCSLPHPSNSSPTADQQDKSWKPWELIYSLCKTGKGHIPLYNQFGKYVVRLFWMGCWRKIVVDDTIPFDEDGKPLLPATSLKNELWPMLLTKALIKIVSISRHNDPIETEEFSVLHCLTGWLPETLPIQKTNKDKVWNLLLGMLPEWKLPVDTTTNSGLSQPPKDQQKPSEQESMEANQLIPDKDTKSSKEGPRKKDEKEKVKASSQSGRPQTGQSRDKNFEDDSSSTVSVVNPEMVVFANFNHQLDKGGSFSSLRQKADSSEHLRKVGLSQLHPHPICISQIRMCPLEPQPPSPVVPRWKLVRPMKKSQIPSDEPEVAKPVKPDNWLEILSPFIGHRIDEINFLEQSKSAQAHSELPEENAANPDSAENTSTHDEENASPSSTNDSDDVGNNETAPSDIEEHQKDPIKTNPLENTSLKKRWIDFDVFCQAFRHITIFHKTGTYQHSASSSEFRPSLTSNAGNPQASSGSKKGSAQLNQATSNVNVGKQSGSGQVVPHSYQGYPVEDRFSSYLFIDNVEKSELVIQYSVLMFWPGLEEKKSDRDSTTGSSEDISLKHDSTLHATNGGLLVAETYSWKNTTIGQPILQIQTTGSHSVCLPLPPGRHILRFILNFPLGYNLKICSTTPFIFGDEETVLASLQQESLQFVAAADQIVTKLGNSIESFGNKETWKKSKSELHEAHMPYKADMWHSMEQNYEVWCQALYEIMDSLIGDSYEKHDLLFALKCLNMWIPQSNLDMTKAVDQQLSKEEMSAATRIQKHWRGMVARKMYCANTNTLSEEHASVIKILSAFWNSLQTNRKANSCNILRNLLTKYPDLIYHFPFQNDEWNKLSFVDYQGTFSEQPARTWFILLREVFHVDKEILCLPKLYHPVPTCNLHMIDNDTGNSIPEVFQKVVPYTYRKNKKGYTLVAEARTLESAMMPGKWKLRMIGSIDSLPTPVENFNSSLHVKEIRDYYIPNSECIILRYVVKCNTDLIASVQLETSNEDVHIVFEIFDKETKIKSVEGKGHCVIPAFSFMKNNLPGRPVSGMSNKESHQTVHQSKQNLTSGSDKKPHDSSKKQEGDLSMSHNGEEADQNVKEETHSYILQAKVAHKSWQLSAKQWSHIQKLMKQEKEDLKAFSTDKERPGSTYARGLDKTATTQKLAAGVGDKAKKSSKNPEKTGKDKKSQEKEIASRPQSQNLYDESRAFWTLRFVVNVDHADDVEVKKDTHRLEEIKAMKLAWEAAEPGRSIKAMQSRLTYTTKLSGNTQDQENAAEPHDESMITDVKNEENLTDPQKRLPTLETPLLTTKLYEKGSNTNSTVFLNKQSLIDMEDKKVEIDSNSFKQKRSKALEFREQNQQHRSVLMDIQFDKLHEMQCLYDKSRNALLAKHAEYRKACLADTQAENDLLSQNASPEQSSPEPKQVKSAGKKKK